jgi:hypothetical protein
MRRLAVEQKRVNEEIERSDEEVAKSHIAIC